MQDYEFADAAKPAPARVLRLRMLKYSIGHEIILLNKRNPFAVFSGVDVLSLPLTERLSALFRAAMVCSQTWEDSDKPQKWVWLWRLLLRKSDEAHAVDDFLKYRNSGSTFPKTNKIESKNEGRCFGSPLVVRLLNCVGGDYNYPLGDAQWRYFSKLEDEGLVQVENSDEKEIREEVEKHQADYAREQEEKKKEAASQP